MSAPRHAGEPDDRPLPPTAELERVAFLLERAQAATPRVKAFRGAAARLDALGEAEVRARVADGTLTELPGIGASTAGVVADAAAGRVSEYRARLEAQVAPLVRDGHALRAALQGDLHSHTLASDGGSSIETMARTAAALGHRYLAVTDHSPRLTVANGLSAERLLAQLDEITEVQERLDADGVDLRVLSGIEVDVLDDGALDQDDDLLDRLDVVVASVHSKLRMPRDAMTRRMLRAVADPRVDVLGHCTGRLLAGRAADSPGAGRGRGGRPQSEFDAEAVFAACADHGTAVEVNARPERLDPPTDLLALARDAGCLFSIDSDAHAPGQLDWQQLGCARVEHAGIDADRVLTTWDVDRLLAWTAT
ncbi:PHP domain-containing protein [Aquipuribacter nitratireducens]|uniref:PHP domain-containing protein n=1 Tax=Aquipuribacter nitratireducens TaxID=650104 RepID=A0ABW0GPE9_9MICO